MFLIILILILFSVPKTYSQNGDSSLKLPAGLGLSNQLEYGYDYKSDNYTFENWFNLDYRFSAFSAGIRFIAFLPNDPNPAIHRGKEKFSGIDFNYIKAEFGNNREGIDITAGNFYSLFSYGLVLKSYEDRNIRIDNNILGVKVDARYSGFNFTFLSGAAETDEAERRDVLHAADLEYRGIKNLRAGITHAINIPYIFEVEKTSLTSFRIKPSFGNFDLYAEYGFKKNKTVENIINESLAGKAFYGSASFYEGPFSVIGEYKYYDNFTFTSSDGSIIYNTPPAVRRDYTYSLLNRHPSPLNQNNEQGFQTEINYLLNENTSFVAGYGLTKTLPANSIHQKFRKSNVESRNQLQEFYFQGKHHWSEKLYSVFALGYNEELEGNTKNITPIIETNYYLDNVNTLRIIFEHQLTKNNSTQEEYYTSLLLLELLHSPWLSIAFVGEMLTKELTDGRIIRPTWKFIQSTFSISNHTDLSILIGSRQAGNICVGGVCRYEPEFHGAEIKMLTRF